MVPGFLGVAQHQGWFPEIVLRKVCVCVCVRVCVRAYLSTYLCLSIQTDPYEQLLK